MNGFKILSIMCTIVIYLVQACPSKFKNGTDVYKNLAADCNKKLKLEEKDFEKLYEDLKNTDQDDKCLSKCILEKLDVVKEDKFDMDAFFAFLEDQVPKPLVAKITETVTKCGELGGLESLGKQKMAAGDVCMGYHLFHACFVTSAEKLC